MREKTRLLTCQSCTYQHEASPHFSPPGGSIFQCWKCDAIHVCDGIGGMMLADAELLEKITTSADYPKALKVTALFRARFGRLGRRPTMKECYDLSVEGGKLYDLPVSSINPDDEEKHGTDKLRMLKAMLDLANAAEPAARASIDGTGCIHCILLELFQARAGSRHNPVLDLARVARALGQLTAIAMKTPDEGFDEARWFRDMGEAMAIGYREGMEARKVARSAGVEDDEPAPRPTCH